MKMLLAPALLFAFLVPIAARAGAKMSCGDTRMGIGSERGGRGIYKYRYTLTFGAGVRDVKIEYGGKLPDGMKFHRTTESLHVAGPISRYGGEWGEGTARDMNTSIVPVYFNDPPADKSRGYIYVLCTN
jgi:hypothetical protein